MSKNSHSALPTKIEHFNSHPWTTRRKKKKRKKRSACFTRKKVRTTTTNLRIPHKQRCKTHRDRCRIKKILNVESLPYPNHENPLRLPKIAKYKKHAKKDLISHLISTNHGSICGINTVKNTKTLRTKAEKYPSIISNTKNTKEDLLPNISTTPPIICDRKSSNICNYCNKQFDTQIKLLSHILNSQRYNGKCIEREMEKEIKPETKEYSHLNLNAFAQFERKELLRRLLIMEQKENEEIDKYINNNSNNNVQTVKHEASDANNNYINTSNIPILGQFNNNNENNDIFCVYY
eukprot:472192_1